MWFDASFLRKRTAQNKHRIASNDARKSKSVWDLACSSVPPCTSVRVPKVTPRSSALWHDLSLKSFFRSAIRSQARSRPWPLGVSKAFASLVGWSVDTPKKGLGKECWGDLEDSIPFYIPLRMFQGLVFFPAKQSMSLLKKRWWLWMVDILPWNYWWFWVMHFHLANHKPFLDHTFVQAITVETWLCQNTTKRLIQHNTTLPIKQLSLGNATSPLFQTKTGWCFHILKPTSFGKDYISQLTVSVALKHQL